MLWMYQRVFYGEVKVAANRSLPDMTTRERTCVWPLALAALVMGVAPLIWLKDIDKSVTAVMQFQEKTRTTQVMPSTTETAVPQVIGQ